MNDDREFLAAAAAAVAIVEMYGVFEGTHKAQTVGILAFLLLDLLKSQRGG